MRPAGRERPGGKGRFLSSHCMYIIIHTYMPRKKHRPQTRPNPSPNQPARPTCRQLRAFFIRLLPRRQIWKLPSLQGRTFYDRLFTPIVTLWYVIFQRLHCDHTLEAAVADAQAGGADSPLQGVVAKSSVPPPPFPLITPASGCPCLFWPRPWRCKPAASWI